MTLYERAGKQPIKVKECAHCGHEANTRQYASCHFEVFCTNDTCNAKVWSEVSMDDAIGRWNKRMSGRYDENICRSCVCFNSEQDDVRMPEEVWCDNEMESFLSAEGCYLYKRRVAGNG